MDVDPGNLTTSWPIQPGMIVDLAWKGRQDLGPCFLGDQPGPVGNAGDTTRSPLASTQYSITCQGGPNGYERRVKPANVCVKEGGNCSLGDPAQTCCSPLACVTTSCAKVTDLAFVQATSFSPAHAFKSSGTWSLQAMDSGGHVVADPALTWTSADTQVEKLSTDPLNAPGFATITDVALGPNTITVTQPRTGTTVTVDTNVLLPTYAGSALTFTPDSCWTELAGLMNMVAQGGSYTVGVQGPYPPSVDAGTPETSVEYLTIIVGGGVSNGSMSGSWSGSPTATLTYTVQWNSGLSQQNWGTTMTMTGTFKPGNYLHSSGTFTWSVFGPATTPCNSSSAYSW